MWRDLYSEVSQPVPDLEKIRTLVNTASGSSSSTDHLAGTNPTDGRTTYMEAARGGTDVHLDCLKIIMGKHRDKCKLYYHEQLPQPLKKRDKAGWSLFMHAAHGGHLQTLEYVFWLHQDLKLSVDKRAIDQQYIANESAVQFVVDKVFNGRIESLIEHVSPRTVRPVPDAGMGAVGDSVAVVMYRRQLEEAAAAAAMHAISANAFATGSAPGGATSLSSGKAMVAEANSRSQQGANGGVNPPNVFDNEGRDGDASTCRNPSAVDEDDRKLPAAANEVVPNAAGSNNNNNQQLTQGTQASNEISDDDAVFDYATDTEGAAAKLAAGKKRKSTNAADSPSAVIGSTGAEGSSRKKKRSPSSSQPMHHKRRPYKLPTARSASQPTSPARQDRHGRHDEPTTRHGISDLESELEKQKDIAKTFEEQAKQAAIQLSSLQEEKNRQDEEIEELRKALATQNKKLKDIKGNLGCVSHIMEGVLKDPAPKKDYLECIKGALGCASRVLDDV